MKLKPLGDRVVIQKISAQEKTESGIVLPSSAQEKPKQGEVVSVGPGTEDNGSIDVEEGDKVIFNKFSAEEVKVDGDEYLVVNFEDVLAKIS